jgi:hypothetical protein
VSMGSDSLCGIGAILNWKSFSVRIVSPDLIVRCFAI